MLKLLLASACQGYRAAACTAGPHHQTLGHLMHGHGGAAAATAAAAQHAAWHARAQYAVAVNVKDNNVEAALQQLRKKCAEAELPQELRKREHHMNRSERKFLKQKTAYNRAVGKLIQEKLQWLGRRRLVKL